MTRSPRWKPPHPPRTIHAPTACPTGAQRYASHDSAHTAAVRIALHTASLGTVRECAVCHGFHLIPPTNQEDTPA